VGDARIAVLVDAPPIARFGFLLRRGLDIEADYVRVEERIGREVDDQAAMVLTCQPWRVARGRHCRERQNHDDGQRESTRHGLPPEILPIVKVKGEFHSGPFLD
jgi:hypothetical protein